MKKLILLLGIVFISCASSIQIPKTVPVNDCTILSEILDEEIRMHTVLLKAVKTCVDNNIMKRCAFRYMHLKVHREVVREAKETYYRMKCSDD